MRVLVVGSGGREHALAWKLAQSPLLTELHAAPGNPGIAALGECHPVRADDAEALLGLARSLGVDLVVIGPEVPLVAGPRRRAAALRRPRLRPERGGGADRGLEEVRQGRDGRGRRADAPRGSPIARPPCVVKADGLAAGKGVFVCRTQAELDAALRCARGRRRHVVVEELLEGPEVSLFALCDGRGAVPLVSAQDFKRAYDGDNGPNTGGMGSYAPVPGVGSTRRLSSSSGARPVLAELARRGAPFVGLALRRADADRGRAAGARVQLPLRRPGDAVDPAAARGRPARARWPPPRRAISVAIQRRWPRPRRP